jgi:hypothetical protein
MPMVIRVGIDLYRHRVVGDKRIGQLFRIGAISRRNDTRVAAASQNVMTAQRTPADFAQGGLSSLASA